MSYTDPNGDKYFLAVDPGITNLAVWGGVVDAKTGLPRTVHLAKFDITAGDRPLYEAAVDLVLNTPWMSDASKVSAAVVETQAPKNTPARIVATSIYGALRGVGIPTTFSGSAAKNKTMSSLSKKVKYGMAEKPKRLDKSADEKLKAKRRREMHSVNKGNAVGLVRAVLEASGDPVGIRVLAESGRKKADDLADAILLGVGLCNSQNSV
jgi:hypothetical protein